MTKEFYEHYHGPQFRGLDHKKLARRQREREAMLIASDNADERIEAMRIEAEQAAAEGKVANLQDTVVQPTAEWLAKGETVPYTPRTRDGTVKTVKTVRRRLFDSVKHLEGRGVLDEQEARACHWFRDIHEAAQIEGSSGVASYGESIRGDVIFGHLPTSEWAAQARREYRAAQRCLPVGSHAPFEAVVIRNLPLERAGRSVRKHKDYVRLMVKNAAAAITRHMDERRRTDVDAD